MSDTTGLTHELGTCQQCDGEIEGKPFFPARDLTSGIRGGMKLVPNPDGPFCDEDCRKKYDNQ